MSGAHAALSLQIFSEDAAVNVVLATTLTNAVSVGRLLCAVRPTAINVSMLPTSVPSNVPPTILIAQAGAQVSAMAETTNQRASVIRITSHYSMSNADHFSKRATVSGAVPTL